MPANIPARNNYRYKRKRSPSLRQRYVKTGARSKRMLWCRFLRVLQTVTVLSGGKPVVDTPWALKIGSMNRLVVRRLAELVDDDGDDEKDEDGDDGDGDYPIGSHPASVSSCSSVEG